MKRLLESHNGNGLNRVSYNEMDEKWTISPPLHFSVATSLPAHKTLVDRRELDQLREDQAELYELRAQESGKSRQRCSGNQQSPAGVLTDMPAAVRMAIEKAKEPPPSALNAKVKRTQEGRSMAVAAMVAKPHMSSRQLGSVFVRFNASARSTMTGLNIDQVDSTSRTSAVRSLAGLSEGQLGNLSFAIGSMRTISDEGAAKLQESNTKHLDAALVAATPSKQPITDWALKEHEIRESLTRSKNAANGARSSTHGGQHAQLCPPTRLVPATARLNRPRNRPSATPCAMPARLVGSAANQNLKNDSNGGCGRSHVAEHPAVSRGSGSGHLKGQLSRKLALDRSCGGGGTFASAEQNL